MDDADLSRRVERAWARQEARFAGVLRDDDPAWGTQVFDLADGVVVLCGAGLFVNRALAVGLDADLTDEHLDELERRCRSAGVPAAVEAGTATRPSVVALLAGRGFEPGGSTTALVRSITDADHLASADASAVIDSVDGDSLPAWQDATATAWGLSTPQLRRASDTFARTAHLSDDPGLLIARDADDGRTLACASLRLHDGLATLGGMSTVPTERRRGLQRRLVEHRLGLARAAGADIATTVAETGSASERNLLRLGFRVLHTKTTYVRG